MPRPIHRKDTHRMKDQDIVSLYFARDEEALKVSEAQYGGYCMTISMNILASRPDAEECVNDTWLRAWNAIPPHKPSNLRTFLGKITRNLSIDRFRALHSTKRNQDLEVAMEELGDALPMPEDTDEGTLCGLLDEFLRRIDRQDCRLFLGRYWYGHSVTALAKHYGISANTVSQRLLRTRKRLHAFLNERGYNV